MNIQLVGGPRDGEQLQLRNPPPEIIVPWPHVGQLGYGGVFDGEPQPIRPVAYRRRSNRPLLVSDRDPGTGQPIASSLVYYDYRRPC